MNKRSSAPARIVAVAVLTGAFILVVIVIGGALGGDSDGSNANGHGGRSGHSARQAQRDVPKAYVVESGDTLISIAHHTGVSVARIEELNPEVDPQILIAGEKLKLREAP
jgi:LysM repeat protein